MDILPELNIPLDDQKSPKEQYRKPRKANDIESLNASLAAESTSVLVDVVTQRTAKPKVSTKKTNETGKKLKHRLQEITDANASMAKLIEDKDTEIETLKQSVQSMNEVLESVPIDELRSNSSIASSKIVELNKKIRQLRIELDSKKALVNKRDVQIQKLERDLKELNKKLEKEDVGAEKNSQTLTELQSKYNALQQRLFETRNKNTELHEKLKLAGKCLQQEIGDSFDLSKLNVMAAQSTCNWRGRAQQILHLQQTINELKSRIQMLESITPQPTSMNQNEFLYQASDVISLNESIISNKTTSRSAASTMSFDRLSPSVRKSEILHRAKVDELEKTIADLRTQVEEHKSKTLALKVRNKNISEEIYKYKDQLQHINGVSNCTGMNLVALNEQFQMQKNEYEGRFEKLSAELKDLKQRYKNSSAREEELQVKLSNTEDLLDKRAIYIGELEEKVKKLEENLKSICGDFLFSCRDFRKEEFVAILDSLETEKNYLMEQNNALSMRLDAERIKSEGIQEQLGKQKIRIARLEGKLRDFEKEQESNGKKKERINRIIDYSNNLSTKGSVGSYIFENSSRSSVSSLGPDDNNTQINDLKHRLEFSNEKIKILEDRIAHLMSEKEQDHKAFQDTLAKTKETVVDTILRFNSQKSS